MGGRRAIRRLSNEPPETAVVQDVTAEGQGIASVGGKRVFIGGALRGETVTFRRVRARRNYDEAELLDVVEASPGSRGAPLCLLRHLRRLQPAARVRGGPGAG